MREHFSPKVRMSHKHKDQAIFARQLPYNCYSLLIGFSEVVETRWLCKRLIQKNKLS